MSIWSILGEIRSSDEYCIKPHLNFYYYITKSDKIIFLSPDLDCISIIDGKKIEKIFDEKDNLACKEEKYRDITELVQCFKVQDLLLKAIYREYKKKNSIYGINPMTHYMDNKSDKLYIIANYEIQKINNKRTRPISFFAFGLFVLSISNNEAELILTYDKIIGGRQMRFNIFGNDKKDIKYVEKMALYSMHEIFGNMVQTIMSLDITYIYDYSKGGAYLKSYKHNRQSLFFKKFHGNHVIESYCTADDLLIVNYKREDQDNKSSTKNGNNETAFSKFCLLLTDICIVRKMPIIQSYNS